MIINSRRAIITFIVVYTIILSILVSLIFSKSLGELSAWMVVIPNVITIELVSVVLFTNFLWKLKVFRKWLIAFPDMTGTWIGELKSNYVNPDTGKKVEPISCMLVIKHKFNKINVKLYTNESISYSFSEELDFDSDKQLKRLSYSYTNEPNTLLDYRSANHRGTSILNLIGENRLKGYYYSDRATKGEIVFDYHCKEPLDELPESTPLHPMNRE